jgi:hypothetical protein
VGELELPHLERRQQRHGLLMMHHLAGVPTVPGYEIDGVRERGTASLFWALVCSGFTVWLLVDVRPAAVWDYL